MRDWRGGPRERRILIKSGFEFKNPRQWKKKTGLNKITSSTFEKGGEGGGKRSVSDWGKCGFGAVIDRKLIELDGWENFLNLWRCSMF